MNKKKFTFLPKSIIVTIVLTTLIVNVIKSCPLVCTCKWKGGKRKVECANKNLTSLLTNIDSETQVLDYSKNHLQTLTQRVFEQANQINLQKLYLSECQITQIQDNAFYGLSNLIELDLTGNMLTSVPSQTFKDFPLLMKLILSGNPIRLLKYKAFSSLKYLATLDLSDCLIDTIESDVFQGLQKLEWLKLEGNKLKNFKFAETLPEVTGGLSLDRNPWNCDCYLRSFHSWLISLDKATPISANPVCDEPLNYRAVPIAQLKANELACAPCIIPSSLFVEINEGKNISFVCQVSAVPEAEITWEFEGNPVSSNSSFVYPFYKYYAEEATTEQVSELFVFDAKKENNGTYRCTAQNMAGKSTSNYTLRVISTHKQIPQAATSTNIYIIVSSVVTLLIVTVIAFFFILCLVYFNKKKPSDTSVTENKGRTHVKPEVSYEIMKLHATQSSPPCKAESRNPDLIINTESKLENCEHLLLLPNDIKQTYLTLASGTLANTAVYQGQTVYTQKEDPQINLLSTRNVTTTATPASTIKLYLSPNLGHNLYVNPFDRYDNSVEQNYWTIHLSNDNDGTEKQHVSIDYCNQSTQKAESSSTTIASAAVTNDEVADLRYNLEGYPFPSKLKATPVALNFEKEVVNTPILSPPDPFKTSINSIGVNTE